MISVEEAIARFRRDAMLSGTIKIAAGAGVFVILSLQFVPAAKIFDPGWLLLLLGVIWFTLWQRTMRGTRWVAESSSLIAGGQLQQAEEQIAMSLRTFSMSPAIKSMSMLNLGMVRMAQQRWAETAILCREVLGRQGMPEHVSKAGRLLMAESLLELGDLPGTHMALSGLYNHKLTLSEALSLLRVQTDYLARVGAWSSLLDGLGTKIQLAELMQTFNAARTQATLALAALKSDRPDWSNWLRRRVELLVDVRELTSLRPLLAPLWPASSGSEAASPA